MQGITRHVGLIIDSPRDMRTGRPYCPGDAVLEMFAHTADGASLDVELFAAPSWEQVERGIRGLDGHAHPLVRLWAGQPLAAPGLEIIGGGKYALREVGGGCWTLILSRLGKP